MGSHDRDNASPLQDLSPGFQEKGVQWTHDDSPAIETERTPKRISPARRFIFSFLVCSLVLFGLSSVHSPRLWQRISCHNGRMSNQKVDVKIETQSKSSAVASGPDQASPEPLNEILDKYFPGLDAAHINRAQAPSMLRMAKRDTNSSSVPARSSESSSSSTAPEPSSEPPTSLPSHTPSHSPTSSSTLSTSTTTSTTSTTSSTKPPPVTSSKPTPTSSEEPPSTSDETTIYTTKSASTTSQPPAPPKVIIETSTRTSNGQVVVVESTITVQPSATGPKPVTESSKPPPSLQNAATRQETRGMVLSVLAVGAVMGALLV